MSETVTITRAEYDRLCAAERDFTDLRTALAVRASIEAGTEELLPAAVADRLIDGESPLRVWREHSGSERQWSHPEAARRRLRGQRGRRGGYRSRGQPGAGATGSSHSVDSPRLMAMWVIGPSAVAPCQCFSPGSNRTTSPARATSTAPPQV